MKLYSCRGCGAPISWIKTKGGKSMPCDASPVYYWQKVGGTQRIVTPNGEVIACEVLNGPENSATGIGYIPHWSTCKKASSFKKGAAK